MLEAELIKWIIKQKDFISLFHEALHIRRIKDGLNTLPSHEVNHKLLILMFSLDVLIKWNQLGGVHWREPPGKLS